MTNAADEESGANDEDEIAVALAIASDGQIYIREDLMPDSLRNGRKVFLQIFLEVFS